MGNHQDYLAFTKRSTILLTLALMLLCLGIAMLSYRMGWNDAVKEYKMSGEVEQR